MASAPISLPAVQFSSEYNVTPPVVLHFTVLSVAPSGATVAVKATVPSISIVCVVVSLSDTLVTNIGSNFIYCFEEVLSVTDVQLVLSSLSSAFPVMDPYTA